MVPSHHSSALWPMRWFGAPGERNSKSDKDNKNNKENKNNENNTR